MILVFSLIISCQSESSKETNDVNQNITKENVSKEVEKIIYPLPTPFEITKMLNKAGASYIYNMSNPVENVGKYFTEKSKALNLGIYGADLSYASTYNQPEKTQAYLNCTKKLSDELGITSAYNQSIIERIESNINNRDSLHTIIADSFYKTFEYLNSNEKGAVSVLVLAGGWIEGLYISTQLIITSPKSVNIKTGIVDQKTVLEKLIRVMKPYEKDNKAISEVLPDLQKIYELLEKTDGKTIADDILNKITSEVERIRAQIVE